ncbi:4-hydroxyphenylacetate 3-monooxygenase, oxygenase component [candidate division KSB1 bacterium]|nr:4-hydroxyphenylacetate 3-monooxygenase, oxygenase component [candidate division KSB1 bacterium]
MPARKGADVIKRLREQPPTIFHCGEQVKDVTTHPAFDGGVRSLAALYDLQWANEDEMLFTNDRGVKVGRSFMIPKTKDELKSISRMMKRWSDHSCGMMGRAPDYLNRSISGYASGWQFLAEAREQFGENAKNLHRYLSENDLCMTHTLINPQANRAAGAAGQADPFLAARVKEETDAGIVIRGCRMLATLPISDEIMVLPSTLLTSKPEDAPYAFGFIIPNNTPGLKFQCRESVDYGRSSYDHPLGSRFEEHDAVVIFDDVFVPWERVLLYRDVERCNKAYAATGAVVHMTHQVLCKNIAKSEFMLGLASLLVNSIGVEQFQHIQEKLAEMWCVTESQKAFLRAAEEDATLDNYGVMRPAWDPLDAARNMFPKLYPRLVQIIQQIGASGLVAMPTEADVHGPLKEEIKKYYQAARADAYQRIPLFRLAWDASMSAFATRQALYEHFFFGDPVRMAGAVCVNHDRKDVMDKVQDFLKRAQAEAATEATNAAMSYYDSNPRLHGKPLKTE